MTEKSAERLKAEEAEARRQERAASAEADRLRKEREQLRARDGLDRLTADERYLVEDIATDCVYGTDRFSLDWGNAHIDCGSPRVKDTLRKAMRKLLGKDEPQ